MDSFDWTLLQSFLAVAETGSYSAAGRKIKRSQPTIGRHIEQLQSQLGAMVFQHSKQGYALTPTGTALLEHARQMQSSAARITLIAQGQSENISGTVRITASEIVATYFLPDLIAELLAEEENLEIELVASNSTHNLSHREADIAVRMVQPDQPDLIARKIRDFRFGLYAAPLYVTRKGHPSGIDEMANHLILGDDTAGRFIQGMHAFGITATRHDFVFRTDNQVTYFEALRAGIGIGICHHKLAARHDLIAVLPELEIPPLPVWLVAHTELRHSARIRRVFDFLADRLPQRL